MKDWIRPEIKALSAYHVPDASGYIKLDAMENPYRWSEALTNEWLELLKTAELNRYPDPAADELKARIQSSLQIPANAEIILGNGSDELIQMILMAVSGKDRKVLSVSPSFVMYDMIARFVDMEYIDVPLTKEFELDEKATLKAVTEHQPAVIFLAYPNNPTGNLFDEVIIDKIIESTDAIVIIDEAYYAFADKTYAEKLSKYGNLLVMRTVSKMGLAGLRLGYVAGSKELLNEIDKVRLPYNINVLTQVSTEFALKHKDVLDTQTEQIKKDRASMYQVLSQLDGLKVYPSQTNFFLFRLLKASADDVFNKLKEQKILIKNMSYTAPELENCLRVTVGSPDENEAFLAVISEALD